MPPPQLASLFVTYLLMNSTGHDNSQTLKFSSSTARLRASSDVTEDKKLSTDSKIYSGKLDNGPVEITLGSNQTEKSKSPPIRSEFGRNYMISFLRKVNAYSGKGLRFG